ncbi:MAG: hypothetical protein KC708_14215 [Anaerolineae bacterium]|nr:hypothetical protein [Anaerolineae bacterium]
MFNRLRIITIGAAYAFGLTSLFTYYTADDSNLLLANVLVIMLAHFMVAIGTIRITLDVTSGKRKNSDPSLQNTCPTVRLWKQAIRRAWPWHAALIVPKMGLSLAFVQYLYMLGVPWRLLGYENWRIWAVNLHQDLLLTPYVYRSIADDIPASVIKAEMFPQAETFIFSIILLTLFALANISLLVAITIAIKQHDTSRSAVWFSFVLRTFMVGIICAGVIVSAPFFNVTTTNDDRITCFELTYRWYPDEQTDGLYRWQEAHLNCVLVSETLYSGGLTLADQGVLLAANIMRPVGEHSAFTAQYDQFTDAYHYDNRPFVLRQMVAAALGLGLYGLLTWGALRLAKQGEKPLP